MPLTRRQETIVRLFSELPGVAYDSNSLRATTPIPEAPGMSHEREPSSASVLHQEKVDLLFKVRY